MERLFSAIWTALPVRQLAVAAGLTLLILVGLSFSRIAIADYQVQLQKQQLQIQVQALKAENRTLQTQIATLQTDAAVEGLARQELGWTKPGDIAVVVVRPTVTVGKTASPTAGPASK